MEAVIENGFAEVAAGDWLMGLSQPVAFGGRAEVQGLRGFRVPDRPYVRRVRLTEGARCGSAKAPFLTRFDALPDTPLKIVSAKLLVAPLEARSGARAVRLVPLSFSRALTVTELVKGWAVGATRSRVARVSLEEGGTLTVRPEALVAWVGCDPTGFCPKLTLLDMLLPRPPKNLAFTFHGPVTVWFEGADAEGPMNPSPRGRRSPWVG